MPAAPPGLDAFAPAWAAAARACGMQGLSLAEDGFSTCRGPDGWGPFPARRPGLYLWLAEDGEAYLGQAVCLRSRLRQHLRAHPDILAAAFVEAPPDRLDAEERRLMALAERGLRLRNVLLVQDSAAHLPLDRVLSREEQEGFVARGNPRAWIVEPRRSFPLAEARQRPKLGRLARFEDADVFLIGPLSEFVLAAVPRPMATEGRFWSASLFPAPGCLVRLNVGVQEVLTLAEDDVGFYARVLCPEPLGPGAGEPIYASGARETVLGYEDLADLLGDPVRLALLRRHALWLARHTTALNRRSHCPALFEPALTGRWLAEGMGGQERRGGPRTRRSSTSRDGDQPPPPR